MVVSVSETQIPLQRASAIAAVVPSQRIPTLINPTLKKLPMNPKRILILCCLLLGGIVSGAVPMGTAFTYQGHLTTAGAPANGRYDLLFTLQDSLTAGNQIGSVVSSVGTPVSNGDFTVAVDFGAAFNGDARWLEISVRTNGTGSYATLSPRQPLSPAPYAVEAAGFLGTIADTQLSANIPRFNAGANFSSALSSTAFSGNGAGVTNLNAGNLVGTLVDARLSTNIARLNANQKFTGGNTFTTLSIADGSGANASGGSMRVGLNIPNGDPKLIYFGDGAYNYIGENVTDDRMELRAGQFVFTNGPVGIGAAPQSDMKLDIQGHTRLNDYSLFLRPGLDRNHALAYCGANQTFAGLSLDGPVLYGCSGGGLGTACASPQAWLSWNNAGNVAIDPGGMNNGSLLPGLTFGSGSGEGIASRRTAGVDQFGLDFYTGYNPRMTIANNGNVGIGTTTPTNALLDVEGPIRLNTNNLYLQAGSDINHGLGYRKVDGPFLYGYYGGALGSAGPDAAVFRWFWTGDAWLSNNLSVATITVRNGSDVAEPFQMSAANISKGSVVIIDEDHPGQLKLSDRAYDSRVAGIVSGGNGINPGIALEQIGATGGGQNVALSGRVYVLADAVPTPIKPGDLLTTSNTPGHAMKVADPARGLGAILGKAMTPLKAGRGWVLVLVSLQ